MYEPQHDLGRVEPQPSSTSFVHILGYGCIAIGIVIGIWIFLKVYGFLADPGTFEQFSQLLTGPLENAANVQNNDARIIFPFEPFGYLLVVILFGIAVKIAGIFLTTGANLLDRDTSRYLKKFSKVQTKMIEKIDEIQDAVKS